LNHFRRSPELDALVPASAPVESVANGFTFTEGPIWFGEGLLFSDIPRNVIYKWMPTGGAASVFLRPSGYDGQNPAEGGHIGSNGLTKNSSGHLVICEHGNRRVSIMQDGQRLTLADRFEGKRLNSPNDVIPRSDGWLYFTDPPYGLARRDHDPEKELPFNGIYRVAENGEIGLLSTALTRPNGLAFSPDERLLYVANSDPHRKIWLRFEVQADGSLGPSDVFFDATAATEEGLPDGMKLDRRGNLYCTGPGGIWVFSANGQHLGTIRVPEIPANCHWGDDDASTLYITARTSIYRIRLLVPGIRP
jgi:gluconolactonase